MKSFYRLSYFCLIKYLAYASSSACEIFQRYSPSERVGLVKMKLLDNYKHVALILCLLVVSWWGSLDALASRVNTDSITDAAVIYGIARSINAAVSLLQSAEVGAFVGSINPGEAFDPINDLIERFSTVMTWSLSSLVLQKILLSIFSSFPVKVLFTIACLMFLFSRNIIHQSRHVKPAWTAFIFIAAMRFSIGIVCVLTAIVDVGFVKSVQQDSVRTISQFNASISLGVHEIGTADNELEQIAVDLSYEENELRTQIEEEQTELKDLEQRLSDEPDRPIWDRLTFGDKSNEVVALEGAIEQKWADIEALENRVEEVKQKIECNDAQLSCESCDSGFAKFKSMISGAKISEISNSITDTIDDLITVLVSMILTTIILPLAFLYISFHIFKALSKSLLKHLEPLKQAQKTITKTDKA
jgi:hypothetical protein